MIEIARGVPVVPTESGYRDHYVAVPAPVAPNDWTFTLPFAARVMAVYAELQTASAAGNRLAALQFKHPGGGYVMRVSSGVVATANNLFKYAWFYGAVVAVGLQTAVNAALPDMWLPAKSVVSTTTGSIQSTDQWQNILLVLRMHHKAYAE